MKYNDQLHISKTVGTFSDTPVQKLKLKENRVPCLYTPTGVEFHNKGCPFDLYFKGHPLKDFVYLKRELQQ